MPLIGRDQNTGLLLVIGQCDLNSCSDWLFSLPNYFMLTTGHVTDPVLVTIGENETELQVRSERDNLR